MTFAMTLAPDLRAFVWTAVRLPEERLRRIDREWERLQPHRAVLAELVQGSPELRGQAEALREYVTAEAHRAAAERPEEQLIPEDMVEAVLPSARALLLRRVLERSSDLRRARAFAALTAPYADILPPT